MDRPPSPVLDPPPSPRPPRRSRGLAVGWALFGVLLLAMAAGGVWLHDLATGHHQAAPRGPVRPEFDIPLQAVVPGDGVPGGPGPVPAAVAGPDDPRAGWIAKFAYQTYVPVPAVRAYLRAADALAISDPACHLTWTTLAGVGRVESVHGQYHGDSLGPDDAETTPIIGPALDGSPGRQRIPDTDHGTLDGDPVWDHALGPMQFLPKTWARWGLRAAGDGKAPDPQNMDDAALTAGRYLCASGGDLSVPKNWWAAVFVYNRSTAYGQQVFSGADAYATAGRAIPPTTPAKPPTTGPPTTGP